MTLTYQLTRGCLALGLIAALAVAAWAAPSPAERADEATALPGVTRIEATVPEICAVRAPGLRLALAPADLDARARHRLADCRA